MLLSASITVLFLWCCENSFWLIVSSNLHLHSTLWTDLLKQNVYTTKVIPTIQPSYSFQSFPYRSNTSHSSIPSASTASHKCQLNDLYIDLLLHWSTTVGRYPQWGAWSRMQSITKIMNAMTRKRAQLKCWSSVSLVTYQQHAHHSSCARTSCLFLFELHSTMWYYGI